MSTVHDASKPNFLIILADQMASLATPFNLNPVVKAPNLSRLGEGGVVFESTYCASPLCAPSRASLLTGQLPSRTGVYDNAAEFPSSVPTFAHYLRSMGYYTCFAGKAHMIGPDQLHGFEERLTTDIYPADFGWTPDWEHPDIRPSWYHNMLSIVQAGTCLTSNQIDFDEEVAFQANRKLRELARSGPLGEGGRPFCLVVSFTHPHDPFAIPQEYWDRYSDHEIDLPLVPPLPLEQMDPHSRRVWHVCDLGRYRQTDDRVRAARHAYYGAISYVDDKVGQLLATLTSTGMDRDTVVVFTSDHGEMLGERGLWYKMVFFEWAARVPLVIYAPGRIAPHRIACPVSGLDILPTLVELAVGSGGNPPLVAPVDGRSLVPHLQGGSGDAAEPVVSEILCEGAIAPCFMLRKRSFKYIYSQPDPDQLYDLSADPDETTNLAGKPAYEELRRDCLAEVMRRWDPDLLRRDVIASQQRRRLVDQALRTGKLTPWDHQPFTDASLQYMRNYMDLDDLERRARFPRPSVPAPDGDEGRGSP